MKKLLKLFIFLFLLIFISSACVNNSDRMTREERKMARIAEKSELSLGDVYSFNLQALPFEIVLKVNTWFYEE